MSLKTLLSKIGAWIKGLFNALERAWDKLSPELQEALKKGSGFVSVLNDFVGKTPDEVFVALQKLFPNVTKEEVEKALGAVTNGVNIAQDLADSPDITDLFTAVQGYLEKAEGKDWAQRSATIAKIIASVFAPDGTKWNIFEFFGEFVFRKFFYKP